MQTRTWHFGSKTRNLISAVLCAVLLGGALAVTTTPAQADEGWRHHEHERGWHRGWEGREWHEEHHRRHPPYAVIQEGYYAPPRAYYAPPPRVYYAAPPPPVFYAPAPSLSIVIPFR